MFCELLDEGLEPFEVQHLWLATEEPNTYVDISQTLEIKIEALRRHVSQGTEGAEDWVRERAREVGKAGGLELAEAFKAFSLRDEDQE